VLPNKVAQWLLTTLREKLVKIGARIVHHARYLVFQLAEVAVPRTLFAAIFRRIDRERGPLMLLALTGASHRDGRSRGGRIMHRRSAKGREQPRSACEPRFGGPSPTRSAAEHALTLTEDRPKSKFSGIDRAHLGDTG
jgi:Transposase DDE domain group 1